MEPNFTTKVSRAEAGRGEPGIVENFKILQQNAN